MTDDDELDGLVVPDVAEPIVAYRVWPVYEIPTAVPDGGRQPLRYLTATRSRHIVWFPCRDETAQCLHEYRFIGADGARGHQLVELSDHQPPSLWPDEFHEHHADGYGCGLYGFSALGDALELAIDSTGASMPRMVGRVVMWGRCIGHTHGWRAEHARITALYRTPETWSNLTYDHQTAVAARYEVPLVELPSQVIVQRATVDVLQRPDPTSGAAVTVNVNVAPILEHLSQIVSSVPPRAFRKLERLAAIARGWDRAAQWITAPWRRYPRAVPLALGALFFAAARRYDYQPTQTLFAASAGLQLGTAYIAHWKHRRS